MFTRPGAIIDEFLEGQRVKYFRPLAYVVIMSAICTLIVKGLQWLMIKTAGTGAAVAHDESGYSGQPDHFRHLVALHRPRPTAEVEEAGSAARLLRLGIPDRFIEHGDQALLLADIGLDCAGIVRAIRACRSAPADAGDAPGARPD